MTTLADTIGNPYFQLSTLGVGALAVGVEDIRQCVDIILRTIPGTDPLRPQFGCDAYKYADKAINVAIPNIKSEIFQSLSLWEPRIDVVTIAHDFEQYAQLAFNITYRIIDDNFLDSIVFVNGSVIGSNNNTDAIILSAIVPAKVVNGVYRVSFIIDDKSVLPAIPAEGFTSPSDMLIWINAHWFNYGKWYLTANSLILYLNAGLATKAFLSVTETAQISLTVALPVLGAGEYFNLAFAFNDTAPAPDFPNDTINTAEGLINWLLTNWSTYGNWSITSSATGGGGDFSGDFTGDFSNDSGVTKYLNYQSVDAISASLNFE